MKRNTKITRILAMIVFSAIIMSIATACSSGGGDDNSVDVIELRLAHFWPANHPAETDLVIPWAEAIKEATDGRIIVTSYPGEILAQADAIYEGVKQGVADIGLSCFSYTRGQFPIMEVFELPGIVYNTSEAASRVAWEGAKLLNPAEIQDTTMFMIFTTGPGHLFTRTPVRELSDLQGFEIRATGLSATTLSTLGAMPVAMSQAEAYEAISKGVVRGNLSPLEVLKGWGQADVTNYITLTPFLYNTLFFFTMNTDKWNEISPEDQAIILDINERFFEEVACSLWDKQNEEALSYALEEKGLELIELDAEEAQLWIDLIEPILDDFAARMDAQGFNGNEIIDTVKELANTYN
ncbi:MAG: TRAP transporter substrate-binding protein [Oscillospiraceae bacterium]|nr:TRAP transporter substrate-binding protein [Oscillospiraceae bacterium]